MSQSSFCEQCGVALAADARFCEACGRAVSAPSAPAETGVAVPSSATPRPSQPRWLIAGCVAVVAVIAYVGVAAMGGFFAFQTTVKAPATPTPAIAATTPVAKLPATIAPVLSVTPAIAAAPPTIPPPMATTGAQPTYSAVTFSSAFDASTWTPINPGKVFPYGVRTIYAYWTYSGIAPNTDFEYEWLFNNTRVDSDTDRLIESSGKSAQWLVHPRSEAFPLDPGNYQFIIRVGGQVVISDTFVIQ